jgi:glycosyltransferase involved in cell wall biosynthesis
MSSPRYSFVSPIHDEEGSLPELHRRLAALMDTLDGESEMILVDDGSRDASYPVMLGLSHTDPRVKVVRLSRNFGHQLAISAGIDFAGGDAVIVMDGDLQHPPEVVPEFIERWQDGYEVVYGVRRESAEGWMKRKATHAHYALLSRLSDVPVPAGAGDFRLLDRSAVEALKAMREHNRYVRGMVSWVGFNQIGVPYDVPPRFAGKSKYTARRLMGLAGAGITSLSNVPLKLALRVGYVVAALSIAFGISAVVAKLANLFNVPGWTSIVVVTSFVGGVQLILIGVLGEYLALVYDEVRSRPLYLVRNLHGFDPEHVRDTVAETADRG